MSKLDTIEKIPNLLRCDSISTGCPKKTKLLKNGFIMDFFHRIMIAYGLLVYIDYYLLKTWLTLQVRGGYNSYTTGLRSSKLLDISYIWIDYRGAYVSGHSGTPWTHRSPLFGALSQFSGLKIQFLGLLMGFKGWDGSMDGSWHYPRPYLLFPIIFSSYFLYNAQVIFHKFLKWKQCSEKWKCK